jgi:hypothetical protein
VRLGALAACALAAALAWTGRADAHLVPDPQYVPSGSASTIRLAGPNERRQPMTGLTVTVPDGVRIVHAHRAPGWTPRVDGSTATWTGGPLEYLADATFRLHLDVSADPGSVTLETHQLYPGGARVTWPVRLTIVPGENTPSAQLGWALAVGAAGLLVTVAVVLLAWRRRTQTLQEQ